MEVRSDRHSHPALLYASLIGTGVVLGSLQNIPSLPLYVLLLLLLSTFVVGCLRVPPEGALRISIVGVMLCILIGTVKWNTDSERLPSYLQAMYRRNIVLTGTIRDWPQESGRNLTFILDARSLSYHDTLYPLSTGILVRVRKGNGDVVEERLDFGTSVVLRGSLQLPRAARNPGEMSERKYLESNGVLLVCSVNGLNDVVVQNLEDSPGIIRMFLVPVRRSITNGINRLIRGEEGEFLKGLMLGERSGISFDTRTAFVNAGVAHVLAVSGSNVAFIAAVLVFVFRLIRLPRWIRNMFTVAGLLAYMVLTGSQPPVVRATIMALALLLGNIAQRKCSAYNAMGVAALVMMFADTRQIFDVGFQLSFSAVLGILYVYPRLNALVARVDRGTWWSTITVWLLRLVAVTVAATLGTLPFSSACFGKVSLVGIIANVFVVPVSGLCLVLGFITALADLASSWTAEAYAGLNWALLHATLKVTRIAGGVSWATINAYEFSLLHAIPYYAGLLVMVNMRRSEQRFRNLVYFLLSLQILHFDGCAAYHPRDGKLLRVAVLDVGQGDAIFCQFPGGGTLLIDTGPRMGSSDAGERTIIPFLHRQGVRSLDHLLLSHLHDDHIGGIGSVYRSLEVKRVWTPDSISVIRAGDTVDIDSMPLYRGDTVGVSGSTVRIYVLSPPRRRAPGRYVDQEAGVNNASIVVKIMYGNFSLLFPGDAEAQVEEDLVRTFGDFLQASLLKAGHHGSATSCSEVFLDAVNPEVAVISVGQGNRFRHPSPSVIRRFEARGVHVKRTDEQGAIQIVTDGECLWYEEREG